MGSSSVGLPNDPTDPAAEPRERSERRLQPRVLRPSSIRSPQVGLDLLYAVGEASPLRDSELQIDWRHAKLDAVPLDQLALSFGSRTEVAGRSRVNPGSNTSHPLNTGANVRATEVASNPILALAGWLNEKACQELVDTPEVDLADDQIDVAGSNTDAANGKRCASDDPPVRLAANEFGKAVECLAPRYAIGTGQLAQHGFERILEAAEDLLDV